VVHSKRSGMDHTVLPADNTTPAFPCLPGGSRACECGVSRSHCLARKLLSVAVATTGLLRSVKKRRYKYARVRSGVTSHCTLLSRFITLARQRRGSPGIFLPHASGTVRERTGSSKWRVSAANSRTIRKIWYRHRLNDGRKWNEKSNQYRQYDTIWSYYT